MIIYPNAKINLGLNILEKRQDGFHNIESIFLPINLSDIIEIIQFPDGFKKMPAPILSGLALDIEPSETSIYKAWRLLHEELKIPPVQFALHKQIPLGSGLGGGSSDSSFVILALNELFNLKLCKAELLDYMGRMGSDCSFFYYNQPVFVSGVGDRIKPIELDLSGLFIYLVVPDIHISTQEAYAMVEPKSAFFPLENLNTIRIEQWKKHLFNDFEEPLFEKFPDLRYVKEELYRSGAIYSSVTGSGAGVYGLFRELPERNLNFKPYFNWAGKLEKQSSTF